MLKISLFCRPHQLPQRDVTGFAEAARLADRAGLYSIHLGEHIVMGDRTERYPFGKFEHAPDTPWLEPLITLATAASVTRQIRLSTGILLASLRSGPLLAKSLATLDVLSHGRVEPGLGVGWQQEEFELCGVPWDERFQILEDNLRTCRRLWGEQPIPTTMADGSIAQISAHPTPTQKRLPILLGFAPTPKNARRIAEYADGWCPVRLSPAELAKGLVPIRAAYREVGRDPGSLIVRIQAPLVLDAAGRMDVAKTLSVARAYEDGGATILAVGPTVACESMGDVERLVEEIAEVAARMGRGA